MFSSTCTRATRHAEERTLERLKLSVAQLEEMLSAGASVRLWTASSKAGKDGMLLWSPLDSDYVLAWVGVESRSIVTCMPFSFSEDEFASRKGEEVIERAKQRAKRMATTWMLRTACLELPPASVPSLVTEVAETEKVPEPVAPPKPPLVITLYTNRRGQKVEFPLELVPAELLAEHPVSSQRDVHAFINRLMEHPGTAGLIAGLLTANGYHLDELVTLSVQPQTPKGERRRMVRLESTLLDCALADMEYARRHAEEELSWLHLDESLLFGGHKDD